MKYSVVLMALVGAISAASLEHHHHHHHHQAPVVFAEDNEQAENEKPKKAKKAKKAGKAKKTAWTPAQSRSTFEAHVKQASKVVKAQEAFEAKQTSDIKKMNDKAAKDAKNLRNKVGAARNRQTSGEYPQIPFPWVKQWAAPPQTLAQEDPKKGTPAWSYKQKADSLSAVRAAVAEQERFMAHHNKMVADNFAADTAAANLKRAQVSRARQTQIQGGLAY